MEIDVLGGKLGVKARRWGGKFPDKINDKDWLDYLLGRMEGIPFNERTARYNSSWVLVFPGGKKFVKNFSPEFLILERPSGDHSEGFPMSAVRYVPEYQKPETEFTNYQQWDELISCMEEFDIENKPKACS